MIVRWNDTGSRAIRTHEVLRSESAHGRFVRVNQPDLIATSFLHTGPNAAKTGLYRVRAVDYWGRAGKESAAASLED